MIQVETKKKTGIEALSFWINAQRLPKKSRTSRHLLRSFHALRPQNLGPIPFEAQPQGTAPQWSGTLDWCPPKIWERERQLTGLASSWPSPVLCQTEHAQVLFIAKLKATVQFDRRGTLFRCLSRALPDGLTLQFLALIVLKQLF